MRNAVRNSCIICSYCFMAMQRMSGFPETVLRFSRRWTTDGLNRSFDSFKCARARLNAGEPSVEKRRALANLDNPKERFSRIEESILNNRRSALQKPKERSSTDEEE